MAALIIPVHPPFVALPFIQPGHSWQVRAPARSGLINPLGEPLCRSLLGLLPGQEGTPQGSRLINPLGELLRPSPPVGYHHYVIGARYLWPEVVTPSPLPPDLRQLAQSVGPSLADHLQWVEMFSAQQKVLPLVGRGRGTGTSLLASPWPPLVIPVHPPPVALPFIQPGHSWQVRAPAGSGLINPLGEPLCRSLLGLLPEQEGTPQGSRLINPLGELLRPSPPVGYHHYVIGARYLWPEVVTPSPLPPDLRQLAQSVGPSLADHLQWVEMFSAQQKVLPLVGRGRGTGTSLLASPWPPLVIPVHPPPVALPFIQPGHSWQVRAPAGSGLINPLGEPLCRSLLGLLPGQEGTPHGSRLINPLGELLRPSPPLGYHHPSLADHLQWVEMFSAQQKVLPLVGRGRGTGT